MVGCLPPTTIRWNFFRLYFWFVPSSAIFSWAFPVLPFSPANLLLRPFENSCIKNKRSYTTRGSNSVADSAWIGEWHYPKRSAPYCHRPDLQKCRLFLVPQVNTIIWGGVSSLHGAHPAVGVPMSKSQDLFRVWFLLLTLPALPTKFFSVVPCGDQVREVL